jgi:hypothetical protein
LFWINIPEVFLYNKIKSLRGEKVYDPFNSYGSQCGSKEREVINQDKYEWQSQSSSKNVYARIVILPSANEQKLNLKGIGAYKEYRK